MQNYNIESYDDIVELFTQLVLPKYTLDQVPTESVEDLKYAIIDAFEAGDIKTCEDIFREVNKAIDLGFTKSLYFKK